MAALGSLVANLVLQYAQYTQGLDAAQQKTLQAAKKIQDDVDGMGRSVKGSLASVAGSVASAAAAFFTVRAGIEGVLESINRMDAISDRMQRLGIGAEALQTLSYYAEFSSVSVETLDTSLRTLSKNMAASAGGSKEQAALFKTLGVQVVDVNGKMRSTDAVLRDVAERFSTYRDGANKTAMAMEVFGKAGADMIPLLNGGAAGLDDATAKAHRFGLVMSDEAVKAAADFNDRLDDLKRISQGAFNDLAAKALPALNDFTSKVLAAHQALGNFKGALTAYFDDKVFGDADPVIAKAKAVEDLAKAEKSLLALRARPEWQRSLTKVDVGFFGGEEADYEALIARKKGMIAAADARIAASKPVTTLPTVEATDDAPPPPKPKKEPKPDPLDYSMDIHAIQLRAKAESDAIARMVKDNEASYSLGTRTVLDYYNEKYTLSTRGVMETSRAAEEELAVIQGQISSGKGTQTERKKLAEQEQKLTADIAKSYLNLLGVQKDVDDERSAYWYKLQQGWTADAEKGATAAEEQAKALQDQIAQYGMTKGAVADLVAVRAREEEAMARTAVAQAKARGDSQATIVLLEAEATALGRRADALADSATSTYQIDRLDKEKEFAAETKRQNEQIGDSLTDALMRGFEDGQGFAENFKSTVVNMFKTLVLKPIIQPIAQAGANYITSALGLTGASGAGTAAGGQSVMGLASNASSLYSAVTGDSLIGRGLSAIGSYFGAGAATGAAAFGATGGFAGLATANAAGTVASTALGSGAFGTGVAGAGGITGLGSVTGAALGTTATGTIATTTAVGVGGTVGGTALAGTAGTAATAGSMAAAAIPYIGLAIAAAMVLSTMIGSDKTPAVAGNGLATIDASGSIAQDGREKFFGDDRGYTGSSMSPGLATYGDQIQAMAKLYGGDASGLQLYAQTAYSPDEQGASGGSAMYDKNGVQFFGSEFEGTNDELEANLELSMSRAILGGLQHADLAPEFAAVFKGYGENLGTLTAEQVTSINAALEAVRAMNAAFDGMKLTFPELTGLSWEARTALVNFSGGLDALTSNLSSYYETYYSESERMGDTLASMNEQAAKLGVTLPDTKEGFKAMVDELVASTGLLTESSQETYAGLMAMNQTFAGWADYTKAQAQAVVDTAKEAADVQLGIVKTMKDAYSQYLTYVQDQVDAAADGVRDAYERESSALQSTIAATKSYIKSLADLRSSLLLGELSTLSPEQKYAQGKADLDALIAKAQGGDAEAQAAVPAAIQEFLELSRSYNASTEAYQRDFQQYLDTAERMRTAAVSQLDVQQSQLAKLDAMVSGVININTSVLSLSEAIKAYTAALATKNGTSQFAPGTPSGLTAIEQAINAAYLSSDGRNADAEGLAFWRDAILAGADQASILAQIIGINHASEYDGSHAGGLAWVPKDGYRAELHLGERVLTAAENRVYSAPAALAAPASSRETDALLGSLITKVGDVSAEVRRQGEMNLNQRAAVHSDVKRMTREEIDARQQEGASV